MNPEARELLYKITGSSDISSPAYNIIFSAFRRAVEASANRGVAWIKDDGAEPTTEALHSAIMGHWSGDA
jgi:hypothetical protein